MSSNTISDFFTGKNNENLSNFAFKLMTLIMQLIDTLTNYSEKNAQSLGLKTGQTVIDYGCGPARYISFASKAVGSTGKVIALDIHPLAIKNVTKKIKQENLINVEPILIQNSLVQLNSEIADVIYALDMFHMVKDTKTFLQEIHRLIKEEGIVIIEDGHQSRQETIRKIKDSGLFTISLETKKHVKCKKIIIIS